MDAKGKKVFDALFRIEERFDPMNPNRPKTLSGFWLGFKGRCTETYCFLAARGNPRIAREVVRRLAVVATRYYGLTADTPSKQIHSFNAKATPRAVYHLAVAARTQLLDELANSPVATPSQRQSLHV